MIEYLFTKLNPKENINAVVRGEIEKLVLHHEAADIIEYDEAILKALKEVKICDPAIGSGAFPMGLLTEIFHLVETLYYASPDVTADIWRLGNQWNPAKVKENIIQNSIYGVDIEKGAVDIARLRFWLSLVVDEEIPKPLPNLDYKIVVGNSLLSKFEDEVIDIEWKFTESHGTEATKKLVMEQVGKLVTLQQWQHAYFIQKDNKEKKQQAIRDVKIDILINQLTLNKYSFLYANPKLGGFAPTPKEIQKNIENEIKIATFDRTIQKLQRIKKDKNAVLHFFDWKLDFPEIMNEKVAKAEAGFDIVIGNPPYKMIQPHNTSKEELLKIKRRFDFADFKVDLFHLFFQVSEVILKRNGSISYIAPSTLLYNYYVEKLRKWIEDRFQINKILVANSMVFDAEVHTAIYLFTKREEINRHHLVQLTIHLEDILEGKSNFKVIKQELLGSTPGRVWNLLISADNYPLVKKISSFQNLGSIGQINRGLITGDRDKYFSSKKINSDYLPILTGSDIGRYFHNKPSEYVLFIRPKSAGGCWDKEVHLASHKICIRQIGTEPIATLIQRPYAVTGNIFTIICDDLELEKLILAILNSSLIKYFWKLMFNDFKTAFPQVTIFNLSQIPIPPSKNNYANKIIQKVDQILKLKLNDPQADILKIEEQINMLVYMTYDLTYEEACIAAGNIDWISKSEYEKYKNE